MKALHLITLIIFLRYANRRELFRILQAKRELIVLQKQLQNYIDGCVDIV